MTPPRPGRSYTAANGAIVRVDYVSRGSVQFCAWGPEADKRECMVLRWPVDDFMTWGERGGLEVVR